MPKKGKEKQVKSPEAGRTPKTEPLPQVWLPNQPVEEEDLPPTEAAPGPPPTEAAPGPPPTEAAPGPPPTEAEQEQVALYWAMEEVNAPHGWEEEKEIDYAEFSRQKEDGEVEGDELSQSKNSGNPDLFSYAQSSTFTVNYLGHLRNIHSSHSASSTTASAATAVETQTHTLEQIDLAQRQGRLPWVTADADQQLLSLSKYGIKVTDVKRQRVFARHPLHCIANITYYEDTYGKHMVAIRIGQPSNQLQKHELFIYECSEEAQAKDICLTLAQAFEAVYNKMQIEQRLHNSDHR